MSSENDSSSMDQSGLWLGCWAKATLLGVSYVLSMHVWSSTANVDRDHPSVIKRRFFSAFCMLLISPIFVLFWGVRDKTGAAFDLFHLIGVRNEGLAVALTLPLLLTSVLFLGPLVMLAFYESRVSVFMFPRYWISHFLGNLIWWRNYLVAPLSEEVTFRACMIPLLISCYSVTKSIFLAPLFFGVAHLHHVIERIRKGHPVREALLISAFQMFYTTLFGVYSSFLFVRTGHLAAPVVAHSFCNLMGFPDFAEVLNLPKRGRIVVTTSYVTGLILFYFCLFPLTEPCYYGQETNVYEPLISS